MKATKVVLPEKQPRSADRLAALFNRMSIGIVTTAILVVVTVLTIDKGAIDQSLRFAVWSYFFAAAFGGAGVFFDALINSVVVNTEQPYRVDWYNKIASAANTVSVAGGVICWIGGSGGLADHYGIGHMAQLWLLCIALAPLALGVGIALAHSVLLWLDGWSTPQKAKSKRTSNLA